MYNSNKIKELLVKKNMTQKELAEKAQLTEGTISRILLTGRGSFESMGKICEVLTVEPEEILIK